MPDIFNQKQRQAITKLFDNMLDTFGKECRLFYQPQIISCEYCISPVNTTNFSGSWTHGGPLPLHTTICPFCKGTKTKTVENTEIIKMVCDWEPKAFKQIADNIRIPYGIITAKGRIVDLPKIKVCSKIQVQIPEFNTLIAEYKLNADPTDQFNIIQGRYFIAVLERIA